MATVNFRKTDAAPTTWEPDTIYFIENDDIAESYVTGTDGEPHKIGNSEMINALIEAGLNLSDYYNKTEVDNLLDVIDTSLDNKVDKVTGKQLSTEDYTTTEKTKLAGIEAGAEVNDANTVIDATYVHTDNNYTTTEKNKLAGIANAATANDTDANLKNRANHTGTQLANTISDFQTQVSANTDVASMKAIIGEGISDGDTVVDTLSEMLSTFQNYTEGVDIAAQLNAKALATDLTAHTNNTSNPHSVTKAQIGLANVPNTDATVAANITQDATHRFATDTEKTAWNAKQDALGFTPVPDTRTVNGHALNANVTVSKSDVGLGNADNTSDSAKPVSTAQQTALDLKQNKSISAYSLLANNTNAGANMQELVFKDVGAQTYSGTITWDGTAPTTVFSNTYRWQQIGKLVTLRINLRYTNAGATNTNVTMTLPADCPTPEWPFGFGASSDITYHGTGSIGSSTTSAATLTRACYLGQDGSGNPLITVTANSNVAARVVRVMIQYFAA